MKILHTADWHVGKTLKGTSRAEDQIAALAAVVQVAEAERPDLVIVAGDLYETTSPTAEATRIVTRALSALRRTGAEVVAIAGNHDNGAALDALRPWAEAANISLRGAVRAAEDLIIDGRTRDGEAWRLATLPFVSQRYAVRASEMFELTPAEATQTYADHLARLIARITESFAAAGEPRINLVTAHLTVVGGVIGGGEREAHTVVGYSVPAAVFPTTAHYVALGHLHRAQGVPGGCPIRYAGSPLAVDFGDEDNTSSVTIVEVSAAVPAKITVVPVSAGTPLRTVQGTVPELAEFAARGEADQAWLRVVVSEPPRAGLRERIQELLPTALEVRIDPKLLPDPTAVARASAAGRAGRSPGQLFADYLTQQGHVDDPMVELFHQLHEDVTE